MLNFLETIVSYFIYREPKIKREEVEFFMCKVKNAKQDKVNQFENHNDQPESNIRPLTDHVCQDRIGVVTSKANDGLLIDGCYFYSHTDGEIDTFTVGQRVVYLTYRRSRGDWIVKKIYSVEEDWSDSTENKKSKSVGEVRKCLFRTVIGHIKLIRGTTIIIDPGDIHCDSELVKSEISFVEGDLVSLRAWVDHRHSEQSFCVVDVDTISPLCCTQLEGPITTWSSRGCGLVAGNVLVMRDVCPPDYWPAVGDRVLVNAVETQLQHRWRAVSMTPVPSGATNVADEPATLFLNKHDVEISHDVDFGIVKLGQVKELAVEVRNTGHAPRLLLSGRFHSSRSESQLSLRNPSLDPNVWIKPGDSITFNFMCKGKFVGEASELFVFRFKGFKIGRVFKMKIEVHQTWREKSGGGNVFVGGVGLAKKRHFMPVKLPFYEVPRKLWNLHAHCIDRRGTFMENVLIVQDAIPCLRGEFNKEIYVERLSTLLHLEEIGQTTYMSTHDILKTTFTVAGYGESYYLLDVPGLADRKGRLSPGDRVVATESNKEQGIGAEFGGVIHKVAVTDNKLWIKFSDKFRSVYKDTEFDVSFLLNRIQFRRLHRSLETRFKDVSSVLFPTDVNLMEPQVPQDVDMNWINADLNQEQQEAVLDILRAECRPLAYVVFGPPGTGKTVTVAEAVLQTHRLVTGSRILVVTPSNSAADLIAERLLDSGMLLPGDLVRIVGVGYSEDNKLSDRLQQFSAVAGLGPNDDTVCKEDDEQEQRSRLLAYNRINVMTCGTLGILMSMGLPSGHFSHIFVDEAGQLTEPETVLIAGFASKDGLLVLAGDPHQLGPVLISNIAGFFGLKTSLLERLLGGPPYRQQSGQLHSKLVKRLVINYRSLPDIVRLSSEMFYDGTLVPHLSNDSPQAALLQAVSHILPAESTAPSVIFHGVRGVCWRESYTTSYCNRQEAVTVMLYVVMLYKAGITVNDISIITPYVKQAKTLRKMFSGFRVSVPRIGTVEDMQGQEKNVVILSTVRSTSSSDAPRYDNLGFLRSPKRLNVAITRARALLIIIGNPDILSADENWRRVVLYCLERNSYTGCTFPQK